MPSDGPTSPPVFCLDSGAISHGAHVPADRSRTVPTVVAEFRPGGATRRRLDLLLAAGLRVEEPSAAARARVDAAAAAAGSASRLSTADRDVVALALDAGAGAVVVSDDYTVLDVAARLGVATQTVATRGIHGTKDWRARCRGCGRAYAIERATTACDVCGAEVALTPKRAPRR